MLASGGDWQLTLMDLQFFRFSECSVTTEGCINGRLLWGSDGEREHICRVRWQDLLATRLLLSLVYCVMPRWEMICRCLIFISMSIPVWKADTSDAVVRSPHHTPNLADVVAFAYNK